MKEKWKCDGCGDVTEEEISSVKASSLADVSGEPMPISGWGCRKGCEGRRQLVEYKPLSLKAHGVFSKKGLSDYFDAISKGLEKTRGQKFSIVLVVYEL